MILTLSDGGVYNAHFHYGTSSPARPLTMTFCTLHVGECPGAKDNLRPSICPSLGFGVTRCSHKDQFNAKNGRRAALAAAMFAAKLPKPLRGELWKIYLSKDGIPPKLQRA